MNKYPFGSNDISKCPHFIKRSPENSIDDYHIF